MEREELSAEPIDGGATEMSIHVRRGRPEDAAALSEICYGAFKTIAEAHNFPPDFQIDKTR
jgi:hypothetical protein